MLSSTFSPQTPMNSKVTPWEWNPTGAFINQVISRQLVVFLNLGLILSHQFKLKTPIGLFSHNHNFVTSFSLIQSQLL